MYVYRLTRNYNIELYRDQDVFESVSVVIDKIFKI